MNKKICVFCSSSDVLEEVYFNEAKNLGKSIGQENFSLVYGGTNVGLMHEVARSVHDEGGKVIGVIPEKIKNNGIAASDIDELIVTSDMKERKAVMREKSDAFVALPGGFGTLEEILEVITLKQLGYHNKAIVFVDSDGFYFHLIQQFEKFYEKQFSKQNYRKMYKVVASGVEAIEYIKTYREEDLGSKWF
ncbi:MAG: TIGR00730 family Rossman fold protein [Marinifilaceae bacterium]|jgi:uncharacterized protein (TIGR00730 family)